MIYDYIEDLVKTELPELNDDQFLTEYEFQDDDLNLFIRSFWTYGDTIEFGNNSYQEVAILNLEIYEKKLSSQGLILDLVRGLKDSLPKKLSLVEDSNSTAKFSSITASKNTNSESWNSYTIFITFFIYKEF